jgi:transcriptional regulator with XRE-family HTH domain
MVRISKGISQQELADMINRTRPLVSHIEQTGKVNDKTFNAICKSLKISENDLEGFVNEPKNTYKNYRQSHTTVFDEIELLKQENKILKDLVQSQKEIIEMLKSKRGSKK